jgi:GMP synthase-like glutamine amidotransferase
MTPISDCTRPEMNDDDSRIVIMGSSKPISKNETTHVSSRSLHLCMLGCEDQPPYGPTTHTARMLLNLLLQAASLDNLQIDIKITIYRVQKQLQPHVFDVPDSYDDFDGVLLPGSFSAAYDEDEWISYLKENVIRNVLWEQQIPTMGICFGHQVIAHTLGDDSCGQAGPCPLGKQVGWRTFDCNPILPCDSGIDKAGETSPTDRGQPIHLLYTHGDLVVSLPSVAKSLGGTIAVPILGAVYYGSNDANKPVFCTFQAHPEYASEGPEQPTLSASLELMEKRGCIENCSSYMDSVQQNWERIYRDSISVTLATCRLLKWFPNQEKSTEKMF